MSGFFNWFDAFLSSGSFWVYVVILVGKVLEVSMGTLRIVLINRGERLKGSMIAFVEIIFWLVIASSVLDGWKQDAFKGLSYALAYAIGNYAGSWLDEWLAFGLSSLQIVVPTLEETKKLSLYLQSLGYGITSIDVKGRNDDERCMLIMMIKRKNLKNVMWEIQQYCPAAMITVSDVKAVRGGYMRSGGKRRGALNK
ncbi:MAG: DUF2179 domain-containing protein [Clostridia bacterium]|nr:DUF2179 domain-containing protein [Clostridia bacterium]